MSLIYFHIFLISTGILFSLGFSLLEFSNHSASRHFFDLFTGIISIAFSASLLVYLLWFLKKKKPYMNRR